MLGRLRDLGGNRYRFIEDVLEEETGSICSVGCSFGWELKPFVGTAERICGVDVYEEAIERASKNYPNGEFQVASSTDLPYETGAFDVVILSEVIEHVGEENKEATIDEVYRVLKPGGRFIFTAPFNGALAWADPMDFKRRFPRLYETYARVSGYRPKTPVRVGHKHLTLEEVERLFAGRFEVEYVGFSGFLSPFLEWAILAGERGRLLPGKVTRVLGDLRAWEGGVPVPRSLAYTIRISARRQAARGWAPASRRPRKPMIEGAPR